MSAFHLFQMRLLMLVLVAALFLGGCSKKHAQESEEAKGKVEENIVTLTKENLEHVQIKTQPASLGDLSTTLKAAGRVSANMNKTAKISSTLEGRIAKLTFDLNDRVKRGDVLGLVEAPELLGRQLELKAPIDGVVIERKTAVGEQVDKTKEIYTISDPTDLWVIAQVKERDIGAVKIGQDALFTVIAFPDETFHGKIARVGNEVAADSRTVDVRIEANNADGKLKPGMFTDVEITTKVLQNVLVISDSAVQSDEDGRVVFVDLGENRFQKRAVQLGLKEQGRVQVLEGLKAGERVVTDGSFILKSQMLKSGIGDKD